MRGGLDLSQIQEKFKKLMETMMIIQTTPGINSSEIATKLETSTRSVQRYIKQLREAGIVIEASSGHMGGFLCPRGYQFNPIYLTPEERAVLTLAANSFLSHEGFPFKKELSNALNKITSNQHISNETLDNDYFSIMLPPRGDNERSKGLIIELKNAMKNNRKVEIVYDSFSSGQVKTRKLNPYHIFFHDGFWYMVGHCHLRNEIRTFRIDRIKNLQVLNEKYLLDERFDFEQYIKNSWSIAKGEKTKVTIGFFPPISRLIEEAVWHESQQLEKLENGLLLFSVEVEGTWEIKKWIYGFGKYAEVLEPASLREEIREELREMSRNYGG